MTIRVLIGLSLSALAAGGAHAGDLFERQAGLWKITLQSGDQASTQTMDLCLAADTDAVLAKRELPTLRAMCSKLEYRRDGNTYVSDSVCQIGKQSTSTHTVTTPLGNDAYRTVITMKDGHSMTQDGHRIGACPAGMKPGDEILKVGGADSKGMKINLLQPSPGQ